MLNSHTVHVLWRSLNWLTRLFVVALAAATLSIAAISLLLRYWLLPDIEQYHVGITSVLTGAIGNPVAIGKIKGDWDGFLPRLDFTDVRILDEQGLPALVFPHVVSSISWMTLFAGELRLSSLEIDQPELLIRRDAQGKLFVGGMAIQKGGGNGNLSDWLLHQSRIAVHDALIVWVDQQRDSVPLIFTQVNLHIDNLYSHHRFALSALPPEELATPLDLRGDFRGNSFADLQVWHGQIFTQFDFTDATAWNHWLDLPKEFSSGRGAVRSWLSVDKGKLAGITADLALYNVTARLAEDVPEMGLVNLRGRVVGKLEESGFSASAQGLTLRLQDGLELQPTNFYLRSIPSINGQPANIEMGANLLQLETLTGLAGYFPLDAGLRDSLVAYAPSGKVADMSVQLRGKPEQPDSYKIKARFENIAVHQVGKMPGFSGLTLEVDGTSTGGTINIDTRKMTVDALGIMREPLQFDTVTGQAGWQHKDGEWVFSVDSVTATNKDLAGKVHGSYQTLKGTHGILDLNINLTRGDIRQAARYAPLIALNKEVSDWLNGALLAGHTEDLHVHVKGNLSDFVRVGMPQCMQANGCTGGSAGVEGSHMADSPVSNVPGVGGNVPEAGGKKNVLFEIGGHAHDVTLEFAKNWPRVENMSGEFLIREGKLKATASLATMAGIPLRKAEVVLPDMTGKELALEIKGEASALSNTFLEFIQKSPIRGYINGSTDGISASGNGHLDLSLRVPLHGGAPVTVSGTFKALDNDIDLGANIPLLRRTRGTLIFTESGMQAKNVSAEILGGAATINMQTGEGGKFHAAAQGRCNLDMWHGNEAAYPWLHSLHGGADWDAEINVEKKATKIVITSDLQGVGSDLPQPFSKQAHDTMDSRVEINPIKSVKAAGLDEISVHLGNLVSAYLVTRNEGGKTVIRRGTINFGTQLRRSSRSGIWLTGDVPELSMQGWTGLSGDTGTAPFQFSGAYLTIGKLTGYGQQIEDLQAVVSRHGDDLSAKLSSDTLNGEVVWQPNGYENGGKVNAHLQNLQLRIEDNRAEVLTQSPDVVPPANIKPGDFPALDILIDNFQVNSKPIGHFELVGNPEGDNWRLRRLRATNPDGNILGDGTWQNTPPNTRSQLNFQLDIGDAGRLLERAGYPNTVKGGKGKLTFGLSWAGDPGEFGYANLDGTLKVDVQNGRFLKMDPGAGKLLSILSMQSLPKRLSLDFNDVFSKGFQFDNIVGEAAIKNGVMNTNEFHVYGSSAKVALKGSVDLNREVQNLNAKVFPAIGDSVALLALFAVNPAVGIGSLIASTVLGDPLDKLVSFEYNISGTWNDPNVVKVGGAPAKAKDNKPVE